MIADINFTTRRAVDAQKSAMKSSRFSRGFRDHDELGQGRPQPGRKWPARCARQVPGKGARMHKATSDSMHALPVAPNQLELIRS